MRIKIIHKETKCGISQGNAMILITRENSVVTPTIEKIIKLRYRKQPYYWHYYMVLKLDLSHPERI